MAREIFDTPVPGQSLTDEPGNYPWEHAPQYPTVEDASHVIWERLHREEVIDTIVILLRNGMTVENLTRVLVFSGFLNGKFTVDTAILLSPIVAKMIASIGKKAGVEKIKVTNPKVDSTKRLLEVVAKSEERKVDEEEEEIELEEGVGIMAKPSKKPKTEEDEE
jgi:hypothetical protein